LAAQWKTLTLVGTAGVIVGGPPTQNLSGPITAAGLLFQHGNAGGDLNYNYFAIQTTVFVGRISFSPVVNGSLTLTWVGSPTISLQSSTDLIHWATVPNTAGVSLLTVSVKGAQAFYRLVEP
jgi:hypothetical protein